MDHTTTSVDVECKNMKAKFFFANDSYYMHGKICGQGMRKDRYHVTAALYLDLTYEYKLQQSYNFKNVDVSEAVKSGKIKKKFLEQVKGNELRPILISRIRENSSLPRSPFDSFTTMANFVSISKETSFASSNLERHRPIAYKNLNSDSHPNGICRTVGQMTF